MDRVVIGNCTLLCGDAVEILPALRAGHIICDPPFSERTHAGHDAVSKRNSDDEGYDGAERKPLGYSAWSPDMVRRFVSAAHKACDGWLVCMCDHTLAPAYHVAMESYGRYVFAPLPYYAPGSRCRLSGDGPSSWTDWIVVSRTARQHRWGTLPGGYTPKAGYGDHEHMGGKPLGLMRELVRDYSRPGEIVCDPVMGSGTTIVAAMSLGRPAIGIEIDPESFEKACKRVDEANGKGGLFETVDPPDLFGGTSLAMTDEDVA